MGLERHHFTDATAGPEKLSASVGQLVLTIAQLQCATLAEMRQRSFELRSAHASTQKPADFRRRGDPVGDSRADGNVGRPADDVAASVRPHQGCPCKHAIASVFGAAFLRAKSGQMRRQSERSSQRITSPLVAASMSTHRSSGTPRRRQFDITCGFTPSRRQSSACEPAHLMALFNPSIPQCSHIVFIIVNIRYLPATRFPFTVAG